MTLDEAIKRFESIKLYKDFEEFMEGCVYSRLKEENKICVEDVNTLLFRDYGICDENHCPRYKKYVEYAEKNHQLAEWLKELKQLKEQTRWISVSEQSPKESGKYLVTFGGTYLVGEDFYNTEEDAREIFEEPEEYIGWRSHNVIAWMPLPYVPKTNIGKMAESEGNDNGVCFMRMVLRKYIRRYL